MAAGKKRTKRSNASEKPKPVKPRAARKIPELSPPASTAAPQMTAEGARRELPVAGIVASAGGLEAFKKLVTAMPADSGIALVLVPHLDPSRESLMVELLARHTTMPVAEATNGMPVVSNHIYIIPPNKYMSIHDGILRLTGPVKQHESQTSIDLFLRSLADDQQERAICIILSGTGSHGTLGLKAVKAAGGMAMVQDPGTATYNAMPQSAIDTGLADYVLPVEEMPAALVKYVQHDRVNGSKAAAEGGEPPDEFSQVLALLRARTKLDFRSYRRKMLARRVERRMSLRQFDCVADYLSFLRDQADEVRQLSRDLLISVTSFFRDPDAWRTLETEVIAPLVRAKDSDAPVRVWSVGCATGEEPYSLGMLLLEQLAAAQKNCPVQIFATDVDEDALEIARQAIYPETISADVSAERLSRFFTRVADASYQVSRQLRATVTFARQNVLTDAPFSKLDLVVCRNLLIYLQPDAQQKIIAILHFALTEGGTLFLGSSETIGRSIDLFEPTSAKRRIYRRIGPSRAGLLNFSKMDREPRLGMSPPHSRSHAPPKLAELAQSALLRRYGLACVVINRNYEVLHFAGPTEDYLVQPVGPPTHDLLALARPGLESKLRLAIQRTVRQDTAETLKNVIMPHTGGARRVNIDIEPLNQSKHTEGLLLVSFQEQPNPLGEAAHELTSRPDGAEPDLIRQLEQELDVTREDLQSTIEELESSNEELKASNEEIMSMNEELQSTNEELESSKEELQSLNEELTTVNNELHEKVQDLETASNDMANLFNSTEIATVFLDPSLRIKRFTPATTRLFNLIATDVGRPIGDIAKTFTDDRLLRDAQQLMEDLTTREQEVHTEAGRWYARRLMPYRTLDNRIDGVVITFVDITDRKQAADAVVQRLAAIVESAVDAIFSTDLDGTTRTWNRGAERLYGYTSDEAVGRSVKMLVPTDRIEQWNRIMDQLARGASLEPIETEGLRKDGQRVALAITASPLRDGVGEVVSASVIARDMSERKRNEESLRQVTAELRAKVEELATLLDILPGGVLMADPRCQSITGNRAFYEMIGLPMGANLSLTTDHPDLPVGTRVCRDGRDLPPEEYPMRVTGSTGRPIRDFEHDLVFPDGRVITFLASTAALVDEHGAVRQVVGAYTDISSERKRAGAALRDREARLAAILDTAADAIVTIDAEGTVQSVNAATEHMFGYSSAEMVGRNVSLLMPSSFHEMHDGYLAEYRRTKEKHLIGAGREVEARRKDGTLFPVELAVSEIESLDLFTGIVRDITGRKQLEREVLEVESLQQQRIGEDLHDSVAQELTALNLLAGDLTEALRTDPSSVSALVARLTEGLRRSQQAIRDVIRGLLPTLDDTEGLVGALADLAHRAQQEWKVKCTFEYTEPVAMFDHLTATHLYFIAQEAVHNAVKHGQPRNVHISLDSNHVSTLRVQCDGIGLPAQVVPTAGLGLRIMRNRATVIGGALSIESATPSGTVVTCVVPRRKHEPEKDDTASPGSDRR